MSEPEKEVVPVWDYTRRACRHADESPYGSAGGGPYGSYMGRHIIGRDSRILGGVSFTAGHPEIIVVSETDAGLPRAYTRLERMLAERSVTTAEEVLRAVYELVRELLPYDRARVKALIARYRPNGRGEVKLPLAIYLRERAGVCRHQALLAGYLIEKLIEDGCIRGTVSTDRNRKRDPFDEWREYARHGYVGHQWCRYTSPDGTVYILDAAQDYCGRLADVPRRRDGFWRDYFRPEDAPAPPPARFPWIVLDPLDALVAVGGIVALVWHLAT